MILWLLACTDAVPTDTDPVGPPPCPSIAPFESLGIVPSPPASEVSGVAVVGDTLWAHNDSGDIAAVFALGRDGTHLGTWPLSGVEARDFEDIAANGDTIFIGDIGDNPQSRANITIHAFTPGASPGPTPTEAITLTYEDGPRDAETLLADDDGTLWVVSKELDGATGVYEAVGNLLIRRTTLQFGEEPLGVTTLVTGGDLNEDGLVLRTYLTEAYVWPRAPGESVLDILERPPCPIEVAPEPQPEAIGWGADGLYTISEGVEPDVHFHAFVAP